MDYDKIFYTDGYASIFLITIPNESWERMKPSSMCRCVICGSSKWRQQKQNIFEFLIITINRFSNYQHHSNYDENSRNIIFYIFIFFKSKIFLLIKEFNDFELH
jgi:hypothetical protein